MILRSILKTSSKCSASHNLVSKWFDYGACKCLIDFVLHSIVLYKHKYLMPYINFTGCKQWMLLFVISRSSTWSHSDLRVFARWAKMDEGRRWLSKAIWNKEGQRCGTQKISQTNHEEGCSLHSAYDGNVARHGLHICTIPRPVSLIPIIWLTITPISMPTNRTLTFFFIL